MDSMVRPLPPPKAYVPLNVDPSKAKVCEHLLEDIVQDLPEFNPSKGYFHPPNQRVYNTIWKRVFTSFTGEQLSDCVSTWILREEDYLPTINSLFGSEEGFKQSTGYEPRAIQGVNIDGTWILFRDRLNIAMIPQIFHEIGHRIYPLRQDKFHTELGACYFMHLAMKKAAIELQGIGLPLPQIDYGKQPFEVHARALMHAQHLVDSGLPYIHSP